MGTLRNFLSYFIAICAQNVKHTHTPFLCPVAKLKMLGTIFPNTDLPSGKKHLSTNEFVCFFYYLRDIQVLISRVRKEPQDKRGLKEKKESQEVEVKLDHLTQLSYV